MLARRHFVAPGLPAAGRLSRVSCGSRFILSLSKGRSCREARHLLRGLCAPPSASSVLSLSLARQL